MRRRRGGEPREEKNCRRECSLPSGKQVWQRIVEPKKPFQTVGIEDNRKKSGMNPEIGYYPVLWLESTRPHVSVGQSGHMCVPKTIRLC